MTPFEELEFLADYLPDEGEAVLLSRRRGELVCESYADGPEKSVVTAAPQSPKLKGISDASLYGRLLQASERIRTCVWSNIWFGVLTFYGLCVCMHLATGLGWQGWYFDLGIGLIVGCLTALGIRFQQKLLFIRDICPMLEQIMLEQQIDRFELMASMRQHRDLLPLLNAILRWTK